MTETDRRTELQRLAGRIREYDAVDDAFLAKSFTDRLLILDLAGEGEVPSGIEDRLAEHDLRGANEVYDEGDDAVAFAGAVGETTRHHFVDVRTRGEHQSYVVD